MGDDEDAEEKERSEIPYFRGHDFQNATLS